MGALPVGLHETSSSALTYTDVEAPAPVRRGAKQVAAYFLLVAVAALVPVYAPAEAQPVANILVFVLLGTGVSLEAGVAGLPDFGFVAYFAAGAVCESVLARYTGQPFWILLPVCGAAGASVALAVAIPLVRRSVAVFGVVSFCFGLLAAVLPVSWFAAAAGSLTPGPVQADPRLLYYILLASVLTAAAIANAIRRSRAAVALRAAMEDEEASRTIGIDARALKLPIIAIAGGIAGVTGCLFAAAQPSINPQDFSFGTTATVFAIFVLGGARTQLRITLAAIVVVGLQSLAPVIAEYRLLLFGSGLALWPYLAQLEFLQGPNQAAADRAQTGTISP